MRTKRLALALIAFPLASLPILLLWPSRKVRLAKETTYISISAPLADDGLPNYVTAILEKQRAGVTIENNGAILFWQTVGPGKLDQEHFEAICKELKIEPDSSRKSLVNVDEDEIAERLAEWIAKRGAPSDQAGANAFATVDQMNLANACIDAVQARAWTSEQLPPLPSGSQKTTPRSIC